MSSDERKTVLNRAPLVLLNRNQSITTDPPLVKASPARSSRPAWRLESAASPSAVLKTFACVDVAAVVIDIPFDLEASGFYAQWLALPRIVAQCVPERQAPLWILRSATQGWMVLENGRVARERPPSNDPLTTILDVNLAACRREYLNGSFIEALGYTPEEMLEDLVARVAAARKEVPTTLLRLSDAVLRKDAVACGHWAHRARGAIGEFGDLRAIQLLDRWMAALKAGRKLPNQEGLNKVKEAVSVAIASVDLYVQAVELEILMSRR